MVKWCSSQIIQKIFEQASLQELQRLTGSWDKYTKMAVLSTDSKQRCYRPSKKKLTLPQLILLIKLEYAKQQGQYVWLGDEWREIFCSLPELLFNRYEDLPRSYGDFMVELSEICVLL